MASKAVKIIASILCLFIVVSVVIAIVAVTRRNEKKDNNVNKEISNHNKIVDALCSRTNYKDSCEESLREVADKDNQDIKEYIKAAFEATSKQVTKTLNLSDSLMAEANSDPLLKMALEDCKGMMELAIDQIQSSSKLVGGVDVNNIFDHSGLIMSWLSSVISYGTSCVEGIANNPSIEAKFKETIKNSTAFTSNALAIVDGLGQVLNSSGLKMDDPKENSTNGRRLLGLVEIDNDGFPTWFSASNRQLMGENDGEKKSNKNKNKGDGNVGVGDGQNKKKKKKGGKSGGVGGGGPVVPNIGAGNMKPNAIVAQDGSGQFKTITDALRSYPPNFQGRFVIYVKAGIYRENVIVEKQHANVFMYGDGPLATVVTGDRNVASKKWTTWESATFAAVGRGFICKNMGFENTAGPNGHQAVALRVQSEMSAFFNCRMQGFQDTLYVQSGRQFYRNCVILGTVDFIFGDASALIQNSLILVRRPNDNQFNAVTAQGKEDIKQPTGIVIQNCRIAPDPTLIPDRFRIKSYLGRPWKQFATTVVMQSTIDDLIQPEGWKAWDNTQFALNTCYYAEFDNRGPGAVTINRVKWRGFRVINNIEAARFTAEQFLERDALKWLSNTGIEYIPGLMLPPAARN